MDTTTQTNEVDRLYLQLGHARLGKVVELKQEEEPLLDQLTYWEEDLKRKYLELTQGKGNLRVLPKCLRLATTLLKPNSTLATVAGSSNRPSHQHIAYIVLCASKLVRLLNVQHTRHDKQVANCLFLQRCYFATQRKCFDTHFECLKDLMRSMQQQKQLAERALESWWMMEQNKWRWDARRLWEQVRSWWAGTLKYQRALILLVNHHETEDEKNEIIKPSDDKEENGEDHLFELEEVATKSEQLFVQMDDFIRSQGYVLNKPSAAEPKKEKEDEEAEEEEEEAKRMEINEGQQLMNEIGELLNRWQMLMDSHLPQIQMQREQIHATYQEMVDTTTITLERCHELRSTLRAVQERQTQLFKQVNSQGTITSDKMQQTKLIQHELLLARQALDEQLNILHQQQANQSAYGLLHDAAETAIPEDLQESFSKEYQFLGRRWGSLVQEFDTKQTVSQDSFRHKFHRLMEDQIQSFESRCQQLQLQRRQIETQIWTEYMVSWNRTRQEAMEVEGHLIKLLYQAVSFATIASPLEQLSTALQGATDVLEQHHWSLRQALQYQFLLSYLKRGREILNII